MCFCLETLRTSGDFRILSISAKTTNHLAQGAEIKTAILIEEFELFVTAN